jgi:hypothetical protein
MEHPAIVALRQFADPVNWSDQVGCLQWIGKRHAIEYATAVLTALVVICPNCHTQPPYGARCPHAGCPYGLDERLKVMHSRQP